MANECVVCRLWVQFLVIEMGMLEMRSGEAYVADELEALR